MQADSVLSQAQKKYNQNTKHLNFLNPMLSCYYKEGQLVTKPQFQIAVIENFDSHFETTVYF